MRSMGAAGPEGGDTYGRSAGFGGGWSIGLSLGMTCFIGGFVAFCCAKAKPEDANAAPEIARKIQLVRIEVPRAFQRYRLANVMQLSGVPFHGHSYAARAAILGCCRASSAKPRRQVGCAGQPSSRFAFAFELALY